MLSLNGIEINIALSFVGIFTESWFRISGKTWGKFKTGTHTGQYFYIYTRHYILNNDGLDMLHRIPYQSICYILMDKYDNKFTKNLRISVIKINYVLLIHSLRNKEKISVLLHSSTISLFQEFFSIDSGGHVPEIEGPLYLKSEGKKAWKRFYFVLRASGIYYNPKGKSKVNELNNLTKKVNDNDFTAAVY